MHKTCTQELIITNVLGGRAAEPEQYFSGSTSFNGDFAAAEHLIISDEKAKSDNGHFNSKIKRLAASASHRIHMKYKTAFHTQVFWRCSLSCNDEYPHLLTLPDLSDNTAADKVLLLKFGGDWMPSDRDEIERRIVRELPCFIDFLLGMKVPEKLWSKRFGQEPYKNKEALEEYFSVTHEASLLDIIDEEVFAQKQYYRKEEGPLEGTVTTLETRLSRDDDTKRRLQKIGATGQNLGKMLRKIAEHPSTKERIRVTRRGNKSFYQIFPPEAKE